MCTLCFDIKCGLSLAFGIDPIERVQYLYFFVVVEYHFSLTTHRIGLKKNT